MKKSENPIAEQSRRWLTKALLQLMKEKEYGSITIKEITEKAQLARRTYYRNFNSKDEIISFHCDEIIEQYILIMREKDKQFSTISKILYSVCYEHREFLGLLKKHDMLYIMLNKFNEALPRIYADLIGDLSEYREDEIQRYAFLFSAGGYFNIVADSLSNDFVKEPHEIEEIMKKVVETFRGLSR